jgi:hypothetical protein
MSKPFTCQQCLNICLLNDFKCDGELDWENKENIMLNNCLNEVNTYYNPHHDHDNCKIKNLDNEELIQSQDFKSLIQILKRFIQFNYAIRRSKKGGSHEQTFIPSILGHENFLNIDINSLEGVGYSNIPGYPENLKEYFEFMKQLKQGKPTLEKLSTFASDSQPWFTSIVDFTNRFLSPEEKVPQNALMVEKRSELAAYKTPEYLSEFIKQTEKPDNEIYMKGTQQQVLYYIKTPSRARTTAEHQAIVSKVLRETGASGGSKSKKKRKLTMKDFQKLVKKYKVTKSGSKKQIANRLIKLRNHVLTKKDKKLLKPYL